MNELILDPHNIIDIHENVSLLTQINEIFICSCTNPNENQSNYKHHAEEIMSGSRQDIFRFFKGYVPLINVIKDNQAFICEILKNEFVLNESKTLLIKYQKKKKS